MRLPFFYGWVIVAVATIISFSTGPGQSFVFSVVIDAIIADTGLSRTELSALYASGTAVSAMLAFVVSRMVDRFGARRVLTLIALAFGGACFGMAGVTGPISLFFGFAALRALGQGSLPVTATVLTAQWFVRYRGRAMAVVNQGFAISNAFFPPIVLRLVNEFGWRTTYIVLGLVIWLITIPPALLVVRNTPETLGLYPDGADEPPAGERTSAGSAELPTAQKYPVFTTLSFWLLALPLSTAPFIVTALVFHQLSILAERGLSATVAADIFIPYSILAALGTFIGGFLLDRIGPRWVVALVLVLLAASVGQLLVVSTPLEAVFYAALLGVASGLQIVASSVAWANYYGRHGLGRVQGAATLVVISAAAIAPLPLAFLEGQTGSFTLPLLLTLLLPLVNLVLVALFRPPVLQPETM